MSRKHYLGLDLGTHCGYALATRMMTTVGALDLSNRRFDGGGMRYVRFRQHLDDLLHGAGHIDAIGYEEVRRHAGTDAAHAYGAFMGTLTAWAEEKKIPYYGIPVGTLKRHATGKGNADKAAMIAAARARGFNVSDHNSADALAVLAYMQEVGVNG